MSYLLWASVLAVAGLAIPAAIREKSWKRFFLGFFLTAVGIVLPLFVFIASALLVPEWKGAAALGWLDCFHQGKLVLVPGVLWATCALYAIEIHRVENRMRPWIVLGLFIGATLSSACLVFGIAFVSAKEGGRSPLWFFMAIPFYVSVWYCIRAAQLMRAAGRGPGSYAVALCASLPFWAGSLVWSRKIYLALPDQPLDCFVVTAAMRGHDFVVGPFATVLHGGRPRRANRQLATLWRLEAHWRDRSPLSHARFRRLYNVIGPFVARRIAAPWAADAMYLALKPVEWAARMIVGGRSPT